MSRMQIKNYRWNKNYLIQEIGRNELMSKECKKVCTALNFIEYFLILASTFTGLVSISSFPSLVGIPIEITSFAIGLKFVQ